MGEHLLMKRGLYYAPDRQGYTGIKARAGRYLASDAVPEAGISAVHQDDAPMFAPACWHDVKVEHLLILLAERDVEIARLKALLPPTNKGSSPHG